MTRKEKLLSDFQKVTSEHNALLRTYGRVVGTSQKITTVYDASAENVFSLFQNRFDNALKGSLEGGGIQFVIKWWEYIDPNTHEVLIFGSLEGDDVE